MSLASRARRIVRRLEAEYGSPHHDNKDDPLDELVFIILSQMTTQKSHSKVYEHLKETCGWWDRLPEYSVDELKLIIKDAGLSNQKAPRLRAIIEQVKQDFGTADLNALREMPDAEVETYLMSLPGVGIKTARCVMMYSLGREVLPVDTHVGRVSVRTGLLAKRMPAVKAHHALDEVIPAGSRYSYHVNAVAHGRAVCLDRWPKCETCIVREDCDFAKKRRPPRE